MALPRLPDKMRPTVPADGAIPDTAEAMPDSISYNATAKRLHVGAGHVDNVPPEVWSYEVSGKQVLKQWFSYRGRDRSRSIIGHRRQPSPLGDIQPAGWPAEYTTELLAVLNVLGRLVLLEPKQASLLERICAGPTLATGKLSASAQVPDQAVKRKLSRRRGERQRELLD